MLNDLIKHIIKESVFLPDAFNISQDPKKKILLWFFNLANERFEYSTTAINHSEIARAKDLILNNNWVKGRVFKHNGSTYLIAYITTFLHNPLTVEHLISIFRKSRSVIKEPIDYFIDDKGSRIDERILKVE
jgi:hypothetical protein